MVKVIFIHSYSWYLNVIVNNSNHHGENAIAKRITIASNITSISLIELLCNSKRNSHHGDAKIASAIVKISKIILIMSLNIE